MSELTKDGFIEKMAEVIAQSMEDAGALSGDGIAFDLLSPNGGPLTSAEEEEFVEVLKKNLSGFQVTTKRMRDKSLEITVCKKAKLH